MVLRYRPVRYRFHRIDPYTCGCTDCLIGWSIPVGQMTEDQIDWACENDIQDASGLTEYDWDHLKGIDYYDY